jgi:hypothetical protein
MANPKHATYIVLRKLPLNSSYPIASFSDGLLQTKTERPRRVRLGFTASVSKSDGWTTRGCVHRCGATPNPQIPSLGLAKYKTVGQLPVLSTASQVEEKYGVVASIIGSKGKIHRDPYLSFSTVDICRN